MKLDLSEIASEIGTSHHYDVKEDCAEYEDLRCVKPIVGSMDFSNTGQLILVRGNLSTTVEADCSRCLEKVTIPLEVKVEELLPITGSQAEMEELEEEEEILEEEAEPFFKDNIFDLSEYIRQMVLVEIPIRPLCKDVCKGLCPTCGGNLNEGPCNCPVNLKAASPFSVLADLVHAEEEDTGEDK